MDGTGASLHGARWNSPGQSPIYAADSYSAAFLELIVQLGRIALGREYHYCRIDIPDHVNVEDSCFPLSQLDSEAATRGLGNDWLRAGRSALLRVPSAATRVNSNYLINPRHPQFGLLLATDPEPVWVDPRLIAASQGWKSAVQ